MSFPSAQPNCPGSGSGDTLDMFIDHGELCLQTLDCLEAICPTESLPTFEPEAAHYHFIGTVRWSLVPQSDILWKTLKLMWENSGCWTLERIPSLLGKSSRDSYFHSSLKSFWQQFTTAVKYLHNSLFFSFPSFHRILSEEQIFKASCYPREVWFWFLCHDFCVTSLWKTMYFSNNIFFYLSDLGSWTIWHHTEHLFGREGAWVSMGEGACKRSCLQGNPLLSKIKAMEQTKFLPKNLLRMQCQWFYIYV